MMSCRVSEVGFEKKLDSFTLETSKNHLIRNFLRNWRLRVNSRKNCEITCFLLIVEKLK